MMTAAILTGLAVLVFVVFPIAEVIIEGLEGNPTVVVAARHLAIAYGLTVVGLPMWAACLLIAFLWVTNDLRDPKIQGVNVAGLACFAAAAVAWGLVA